MLYSKLCEIYIALEKTTKRLEKTDTLAKTLKELNKSEIEEVVNLLQGKVYPQWSEQKLGMSSKLIVKAISKATGISKLDVVKQWRKTGDLGLVAENLIKEKKQRTLLSKELDVKKVFDNIRKLSGLMGEGTVGRKIDLIAELLSSAKPIEARFIVRSVLEELRVGVAEGVLRDAIAKAFDAPSSDVEHAYNVLVDYVKVVEKAKEGKLKGVNLHIGRPTKVMLAIRVGDFDEGFKAVGRPAVLEYKLDGFRVQIHNIKGKVVLFTRKMENVSKQFSEIIPWIKEYVTGDSFILDAELVGYDPRGKRYLPFQTISQRIKRKYHIESIAKKFPVEVNIFDVIYYNGKDMLNADLRERRKLLEKIVKPVKRRVVLTKKLVTGNKKKAEDFYKDALMKGNEGVMIKNIDSKYVFGRHVNGWVKLKPVMETLDLVITGGIWGEGKRAKWLSSFTIACRKGEKFLDIGKVGTGIKEKGEEVTFLGLTRELNPYIIKQKGKEVVIKPKVVVEIAYEEIQRSPTYESGYALRFPRVLGIRFDRKASECDELERIEKLYKLQKKH